MAGTGPGDLFALADLLLQHAVEALDSIPTFTGMETLQGAPTRQVVALGQPADDCDQVAVYVPLIAEAGTTPGGLGAAARPRTGRVDHTSLNIRVTRCCLPVGEMSSGGEWRAPTALAINTSSEQLYADAWALWNHLHNVKASGVFRTLCDQMFFDGIQPFTPSGACGGWVMFTRVQLDGYEESLGS
jgi:hypothetical protein